MEWWQILILIALLGLGVLLIFLLARARKVGGLLVLLALAVVFFLFAKKMWLTLILLGASMTVAVLIFLFIWKFLAPRNTCLTFVDEGTAKIVVKGGQFTKALIQWTGYTLAREVIPDAAGNIVQNEWDVIKETDKAKELWHPLGGLRWCGLWPIWQIYIHRLRWHDVQRISEKGEEVEKPVFHDEVQDFVLLRPDVYWTKLTKAETGGGERIPIDVEFITTMQIVNPYKVLFRAPIGWVENVLLRLAPVFRGFIANKSLDELLALKGRGKEIWGSLKAEEEFALLHKVFEEEWGIRVVENGIQIKNIELGEEYQEAAAKEKRMELEARGRAADVVGTVIAMLARARGKETKDIQEEIERNPELRKEFLSLAKDLIIRKMGIEGGAYLDIRVAGAEGLERMILNAVAAFQRMPLAGKRTGEGKSEKKGEKKKERGEE